MTKRSTIIGLLDTIGGALSVAAAVENHRKAKPSDLRRLGIDPDQFSSIVRK